MSTKNLLILDVDGVLTDGTKLYDANGKVIAKRFADHDFTAIKKLQMEGWIVCWLSADEVVNKGLASDRGIDFHYSRDPDGSIDKEKWLGILLDHYKIEPHKAVYIGDDLFDLPIIEKLISLGGRAYCPNNAAPHLKWYCTILNAKSGCGVVMDFLYNYVTDNKDQPCG